jgi:glycosyltransferase involved in cell wall biosynthesis
VKKPIAIVSVINDLVTDQRVDRNCRALLKCGYEVILVGRVLKNSLELPERPYRMHRMQLAFTKGPLFYLEYQIRLILFLLTHKAQLLFSNDLDTLLPNYLVSRLKKPELIYDTHELFCEVPELLNAPQKRKIWKSIEKSIFPRLKKVITVNQSIADIYSKEYGVDVKVVRNIPLKRLAVSTKTKEDLGLPTDTKIIILQGAGINMQRGAEEALEAMQWIKGAVLLIVGSGDVIEQLKHMRAELGLQEKVIITGKVPYELLAQYTRLADLGLSLDKDTNLNYRYSLPNKLFDYIHAGVPVFVSNLVEIARIVKHYKIGFVADNHDPNYMAEEINAIFQKPEQLELWKANLKKAQMDLSWEKEEETLIGIIH